MTLKPREVEIIRLLSEGLLVKQIAGILHLTYASMDVAKWRVFRKIGAKNSAHAVNIAYKNKILIP